MPNAVAVSGGTGDAIVEIDPGEHQRRSAAGLVAATDLHLLDRLLTLPYGETVPRLDLSPRDTSALRGAPTGVLEWTDHHVRRVLRPAARVPLVIVRSATWRTGLRRAAAFEPFAQRTLMLTSRPKCLDTKIWEADCLGVGVWVLNGDQIEQLVAPAPWTQRYVKAAGWRFTERAYAAWRAAAAQARSELSADAPRRPVQHAAAGADQPLF